MAAAVVGVGHAFEPVSERIIGCAIEVHRTLGPGLLESCYQKALAVEFGEARLTFVLQPAVPVLYRGQVVGHCRPDFVVENEVVVELKSASGLDEVFEAQVLTYLKATQLHVGLLLNFGAPTLKAGLKRFVL